MLNNIKKLQIDALEKLVEKQKDNQALLKQIDAELSGRRVRSRNTALRNRIKTLLSASTSNLTTEVDRAPMSNQIMNTDAPITYPDNFLVSAFEGMRQKLLDISGGRSRLLNLDQNSKSFVRLVDELPNELAKHILAGKPMLLTPVPEPKQKELIDHGYLEWDETENKHIQLKKHPDAKEWAGVLGIDNKFDLPDSSQTATDGRHTDNNLQSMMYEAALNVSVKKLASDSRTAIDETGNNILFLCLGFLEWVDQADSGNKRLAPLYMLPITISKDFRKGVAVHTIKYNGEDIIQNLILREKLQQEFGLTLPDVVDPENEDRLLTPEDYFTEVDALLGRKQNDTVIRKWKVRRFATIATLSLGKLLMYRDLDPKNWPEGKGNLLDHEVIKRFFNDGAVSSSGGFHNESYVLDDVNNLHRDFPMIEDADSSQMSVLIDVLNGKNLVVEGPPGTGKSQTITNIISAALSRGKTVLFVAEKQAALEVVKRRMDKAGLGDFCLDLHSDKAQKRLVLDDFKQRISNSSSFRFSNDDYTRERERYERARERLQNYVRLINQQWKNTGLTIHEILMAATRYEATVYPLSFKEIVPENVSGESFSKAQLDEKIEQLEVFYNYLNQVNNQLPEPGNWASHPWFGVENKTLAGQDPDGVIEDLKSWSAALSNWCAQVIDTCASNDIQLNSDSPLFDAEALIDAWESIPTPHEKLSLTGLGNITPIEQQQLKDYVNAHRSLAQSYRTQRATFTSEVIENDELIHKIDSAARGLSSLGVDEQTSFDDLARALKTLEGAIKRLDQLQPSHAEMLPHIPASAQQLLRCDLAGLKEMEIFSSLTAALPSEYVSSRDALFDNEVLANFTLGFAREYDALVKERNDINEVLHVDKLPSIERLQEYAATLEDTGLFSWLKPSWRNAKKAVADFTKSPNFNCKDIASTLSQAANWSAKCEGFTQDTKNNQLLKSHFQGLNTDIDLIMTLSAWYQRVRAEYGIGFGKRVALAQTLFTLPSDVFRGIQNLHQQGFANELEQLRLECKKLSNIFKAVACFNNDEVDLSDDSKPLVEAQNNITAYLKNCQQYLVNANISQTQLKAKIKDSHALRQTQESLEQNQLCNEIFTEKLNLIPNNSGVLPTDLQIVIDTLDYADSLQEASPNEQIIKLVKRQPDRESIIALQNIGTNLALELISVKQKELDFLTSIGANQQSWLQDCGHAIQKVIERNEFAITNEAWLDGWIKYLFAKERMEQGGFTRLNRYLSNNPQPLEFAKNAMMYATYHSLAREIYQEQPELSQMSGHEQTALQQQFAKYDEELKRLQRLRVAALTAERNVPAGVRGARAASYTDNALLSREIEKKTRHISIRNLVTRAGDAMVAYKPCFMMSPMAVAKYIPPGSLNFDIVVMDEASQVKPQDALSCFARGKQIVVVGDSKQLPPTSFFEKSISNDLQDEEEVGAIDEAESILDAVGAYFDKRQLRWHYRSRHESLIEFSNHKFYNGNLVVFPSPWDKSDEYGIKFNHVSDGRFINSVNQAESQTVVAAIREHLVNHSDESLGVVAMNSKQRDMIEADLESAIKKDDILREAYMANLESEDPLFIKNLENVQGDERDVIFISFTYGPQEKGAASIPQRFGPINGNTGWRRLNVLFTRAKKRIQAYSSMTADQIILNETSSLGVRSLKGYLQFAQTGQLIGQDGVQQGEPDSDFEIAVMNELSKHGFECVPQVGVAGFFIDIAVRDPGMPGRYLMGVECDGATYHSSKSTRDRDRVRQSVLEGLGWNIRRIWSTDWFKNPEAELKPLIEELKAISTPVKHHRHAEQDATPSDVSNTIEPSSKYRAAMSLKEALTRYRDNVIGKKYPDTDPHEKLLRPDMIERFHLDRPMTQEEFTVKIPAYLRENTCSKEAAEYLDDVLEIIVDYESIESFKLTSPPCE